MPLAALTAGYIVYAWFPLASLWHQQIAIDAATSQISQLHQQSHSLAEQSKAVSTPAEAIALAREEYQMVLPGQALIQVLSSTTSPNSSLAGGDPGLQPLVSPTAAGLGVNVSVTPSAAPRAPLSGFVSRFLRTVEFWR